MTRELAVVGFDGPLRWRCRDGDESMPVAIGPSMTLRHRNVRTFVPGSPRILGVGRLPYSKVLGVAVTSSLASTGVGVARCGKYLNLWLVVSCVTKRHVVRLPALRRGRRSGAHPLLGCAPSLREGWPGLGCHALGPGPPAVFTTSSTPAAKPIAPIAAPAASIACVLDRRLALRALASRRV